MLTYRRAARVGWRPLADGGGTQALLQSRTSMRIGSLEGMHQAHAVRASAHRRLAHLHGAVAGVEHGGVGLTRVVQPQLPERPRPYACRGAQQMPSARLHATAPWPHNDRHGAAVCQMLSISGADACLRLREASRMA